MDFPPPPLFWGPGCSRNGLGAMIFPCPGYFVCSWLYFSITEHCCQILFSGFFPSFSGFFKISWLLWDDNKSSEMGRSRIHQFYAYYANCDFKTLKRCYCVQVIIFICKKFTARSGFVIPAGRVSCGLSFWAMYFLLEDALLINCLIGWSCNVWLYP